MVVWSIRWFGRSLWSSWISSDCVTVANLVASSRVWMDNIKDFSPVKRRSMYNEMYYLCAVRICGKTGKKLKLYGIVFWTGSYL